MRPATFPMQTSASNMTGDVKYTGSCVLLKFNGMREIKTMARLLATPYA